MIYLDSAATTLQKPTAVANAINLAMRRASSPGRGGHPWGMEAAKITFRCRQVAAQLFHVPQPEQIVFTHNATHGLNIAIQTLVRPGSTVLISGYEHNAVTRPLHAIPNLKCRVALSRPFDSEGILHSFRDEIKRGVDVVICTHVSNVFGFVLPIHEIAQLCKQHHIPLIIDASQSAGCVPIDFTELGAEFIAMPGHKGLYGPQGTGLLLCSQTAQPIMYGGTGSLSSQQTMPDFLPDRLEAGTPNVPGLAGLMEGMRFVQRMGVERIARHEQKLVRLLGEELQKLPRSRVFLAPEIKQQSGVISFILDGLDCEQIGEWLGNQGVAVRAGLHCAPLAHQTAGTWHSGTVRASISAFNTLDHVYTCSRLLWNMCVSCRKNDDAYK